MNEFIAEPAENIVDDRADSKVSSFLEFLRAASEDPNRKSKLNLVEEDIELKRDFHAPLPNGRRPMMKSSLYAIVTRKMRVTGVRTPKVTTTGTAIEDQVANDMVMEGLDEISFNRIHKTIYDRYETEGNGFLVLMEINGSIVPKVVPLGDMYLDPEGHELFDENTGIHENNIRWFGFREKLKRSTFNKMYPDFIDTVASGSPLEDPEEELNSEGELETTWSLDDDVEIFHCFSLINDKPVWTSIAGCSATKLDGQSGKRYKYRTSDGDPYLPLCAFSFSDEKIGIYSASAVSFVKDGAEALKKNFNSALQNVGRIINAPTYLFGTSDEADIDEIANYYQAQEYGHNPIIQRQDPNISIQSIAPQDVTPVFANIKSQVMDDMSERLGFQLRRQEDNPSMKVSIYVRQERDESDAVKAIDGRNEDVYLRLFKMLYWMKLKSVPVQKREIKVDKTEVEFKPSEVKKMLADHKPHFEVDTDMDAKLSFQEKLQAIDVTKGEIFNLYAAQINDETVAKMMADAAYRKAVMLGQAKHYTKEQFIEAAMMEPPPELDLAALGGNPTAPREKIGNESLAFQSV